MVCPRLNDGAKGKVRPWMLKQVQHDERMGQHAEPRIPQAVDSDDFGSTPFLRHCERSEAIQGGYRLLWIAARLRRSRVTVP